MGKSAPSPPAAPNPTTVANAQSAANVDTASAQTALNDVNQYTPYGSSTYSQTGQYTTPNGETVPTYSQTVNLTPNGQTAVSNQQALTAELSNYGLDNLPDQLPTQALSFNNLPIQSGIDTSSVPGLTSPFDFGGETQQAQDAAFKQGLGLIQPELDYQKSQLESQMRNQGIPEDSPAWAQQETLLANNQGAQVNNLAEGAVGQGNQEQATLSGEALSNNQAGFNEAAAQQTARNAAQAQAAGQQQTVYQEPFNLLSALIQGAPAVGQPNVSAPAQTGIAPTDVTGAYALQNSANQSAYQAQAGQASSGNSAMAGLAGAAMTAAAIF